MRRIQATSPPLGVSAGTDEAIHLVDSIIEAGPLTRKFPNYFVYKEKEKTYRFDAGVRAETITKENRELADLWIRAKRYAGKGCLNAVANVTEVIAPQFLGRRISALGTLADIDRELLLMELELATKRGSPSAQRTRRFRSGKESESGHECDPIHVAGARAPRCRTTAENFPKCCRRRNRRWIAIICMGSSRQRRQSQQWRFRKRSTHLEYHL
jgi:hypothetical protein